MTNESWQNEQMGMMAPPVEITEFPDRPARWPTPIGVIGIVLASIGLICGCLGFFSVPLQRWGMNMQSQSGVTNPVAEAQLAVAEQFNIVAIILTTVGLLTSLWLLFGSISLLQRKRSSRTMLIGWAMASIVLMVINMIFQWIMAQAVIERLNQQGDSNLAGQVWAGIAIGVCIGVFLGMGYPIFTLIWFSLRKIKAEVDTWRGRGL